MCGVRAPCGGPEHCPMCSVRFRGGPEHCTVCSVRPLGVRVSTKVCTDLCTSICRHMRPIGHISVYVRTYIHEHIQRHVAPRSRLDPSVSTRASSAPRFRRLPPQQFRGNMPVPSGYQAAKAVADATSAAAPTGTPTPTGPAVPTGPAEPTGVSAAAPQSPPIVQVEAAPAPTGSEPKAIRGSPMGVHMSKGLPLRNIEFVLQQAFPGHQLPPQPFAGGARLWALQCWVLGGTGVAAG